MLAGILISVLLISRVLVQYFPAPPRQDVPAYYRYIPPPVEFAPTADNPGGPSEDLDAVDRLDTWQNACDQSTSWGKTGPVPHIPGAPLATVTEPATDPHGRPSVRTPEFVDDEPVLYAHTSVWAATSDYLWTLMPAQSCQEHETTVWYRVDALRLAHPEIDWDVVPAGMPFMSIRGSHG